MKTRDLLTICLQNLTRHKGRTMLTVLGVLVGCCSIIIMLSIGIGMKEQQEKMLSEMGDLTIITVYPSTGPKAPKLDKAMIKTFERMKNVDAATPKLKAEGLGFTLYGGADRRYVVYDSEIVGMDPEAAQKMGYSLLEGSWPEKKPYKVLVGQSFAYSFSDTKRPEGKNMVDLYGGEADGEEDEGNGGAGKPPPPFFDPMKTPLVLMMDDGRGGEKKVTQKLEVSGVLKEDYGKGMETSMGLVMRTRDLEAILDAQSKLSGTTRKKKKGYDMALIKVHSIQDVAKTEEFLKKTGFRTSSMESIRKPMEKDARQKQLLFGGLGAISLFVAALGITNTMIMSITERTREIGVMKSLGCFVNDIRKIFLLEAGFIGLLGGAAGTVLSLFISCGMNLVSAQPSAWTLPAVWMALTAKGSRMSVIPWWLILFALIFSVMIGVGAGYYPANKAVSIPALEAIKHD